MSSPLMLVSVYGLLDAAIKSAAVLLVAVVVAAHLRRASAAWRHLVWCLSVASLLFLPVLSLVLPAWSVVWLPQWSTQPAQVAAARQAVLIQADPTAPLADAEIVLPTSAAALATEPRRESFNLPPATIETIGPPRPAMPWLAIAWLAGGLLALVPLMIGLWQLAGLHRRSQVIADRHWLTLLEESVRQLGVRRRVQLRQCDSSLGPLTWGALRPVILVPFEAGAWPDKRRRLVLLHELAHVRRWDWLTQLMSHVACAVYWFNPLVWWAARQMRIERERACDDIVLASGARPSDYARELLALAAGLSHSPAPMLAALPMARRVALDDRLRGILDNRHSRAAVSRAAACLATVLATAAVAPLAMLRAAPPESTKPETAEATKEPPAGRTANAPSVVRKADEVDRHLAPPVTLDNPEVKEVWDVTVEEAVRTALANSKVLRNLGGLLLTPVVPQENANHAEGSVRDPKVAGSTKVRLVLARTRDDLAPGDFEAGVRAQLSDVERAYWDLYYNYRNLNAVQAARDNALANWHKVYALYIAGGNEGEAEKEGQVREQYFMYRAQVENTLGLLYTAERRLRYMMGLAAADDRLIRPADEPTTAKVSFDWKEVVAEGLDRGVELRRQRSVVKQNELKLAEARQAMSGVQDAELALAQSQALFQDQELELTHVLTNSIRDLDRNYLVSRTTFNRRVAARANVEAVQSAYDAGTATLDMLLDAQRRLADAEIAYHRAIVDYNVAILQVHYRKNSLLEYNGILLTEDTLSEPRP